MDMKIILIVDNYQSKMITFLIAREKSPLKTLNNALSIFVLRVTTRDT